MKIKALKNYKWGIRYVAHAYMAGQEYDVEDDFALTMIEKGYAENMEEKTKSKETLVQENKAVENVEEKTAAETVGENKSESQDVIESVEKESTEDYPKKKKGRKSKSKG